MGESLQGEVWKKTGFGNVKIKWLKNTDGGALGLVGYDRWGVRYKLLPARDGNLAAMIWSGKEGTNEGQLWERVMYLLLLGGVQSGNRDVFVGPAVKYSNSGVSVDEGGAALWRKAV